MVKKLKAMAEGAASNVAGNLNKMASDNQMAAAVKDSAQQIWMAGLGAFSKAQSDGKQAFETLVKQGAELHKRTRKMTDEKMSEVTTKVTKVAGDVSKQANDTWDKLEQVFEDRVARSLNRLGVPTKKDVQNLSKRVEDLTAAVGKLAGKPVARKAAAAPAAKSTAKTTVKAAAKPAAKAAKKAPAKKAAK